MKTREQVTATGEFPISRYQDDQLRETTWAKLRADAAADAARSGLVLAGDGIEGKSVIYVRYVGTADNPQVAECSLDQADYVRLRLAVWAVPA